MRSLLAHFFEWLLSQSSDRFRHFRAGRLIHEAYLKEQNLDLANITPAQRSHAFASPELKEAESSYRKALETTEKAEAFANLSIVHQQLGLLHYMRGETALSKEAYAQSLSILQNQPKMGPGELDAVSTCHFFLALLALDRGENTVAREHILKAQKIDEKLNNLRSVQMNARLLERCDKKPKS